MNTLSTDQRQLIRARKNLHHAIQGSMKAQSMIVTEQSVEIIKRRFLWLEFRVETSKSLDLAQLTRAKSMMEKYDLKIILDAHKRENPAFDKRTVMALTVGQYKKIIAISKHSMKLTMEAFLKYMQQSIGRKDSLRNLSITEADKLIKRLEQWEAKIL